MNIRQRNRLRWAEEIVEETKEVPPAEDVVAEAVEAALKNAMTQIGETGAVGQEAVEKVQMALAAGYRLYRHKNHRCVIVNGRKTQ